MNNLAERNLKMLEIYCQKIVTNKPFDFIPISHSLEGKLKYLQIHQRHFEELRQTGNTALSALSGNHKLPEIRTEKKIVILYQLL